MRFNYNFYIAVGAELEFDSAITTANTHFSKQLQLNQVIIAI